MERSSAIPAALARVRRLRSLRFLSDLRREWESDHAGDVADALTFNAVLALFPFLLFLVSLAGIVIDPATAEHLVQELAVVAPPDVTTILGDRIRALGADDQPGLMTLSGVFAVWAASGGITSLIRALNTVYGAEERRPWIVVRGVAVLTTLIAAALSIVASAIAVVVPVLAEALGQPLGTMVSLSRVPIAAALMLTNFSLLYRYLPAGSRRWRRVVPGAAVAVLIWGIASWAFSLYVRRFGQFEASYGALGGFVVLLLWMRITAQAILLGAEVNGLLEGADAIRA